MLDPPLLPPDVMDVLEALSQRPFPSKCPTCGCAKIAIDLTFFTLGRDFKAWVVPTQLCPNCQLTDTDKYIPLGVNAA